MKDILHVGQISDRLHVCGTEEEDSWAELRYDNRERHTKGTKNTASSMFGHAAQ